MPRKNVTESRPAKKPAKASKVAAVVKEDPVVAKQPTAEAQAPVIRSNPLIQFAKRFERAGVGKAIQDFDS
jgi:hypothetical protein